MQSFLITLHLYPYYAIMLLWIHLNLFIWGKLRIKIVEIFSVQHCICTKQYWSICRYYPPTGYGIHKVKFAVMSCSILFKKSIFLIVNYFFLGFYYIIQFFKCSSWFTGRGAKTLKTRPTNECYFWVVHHCGTSKWYVLKILI